MHPPQPQERLRDSPRSQSPWGCAVAEAVCLGALSLLALHLARSLVQGVPQDGVLLLQTGQLCVGAILQLFLKSPDLKIIDGASECCSALQRELTSRARLMRLQPIDKTSEGSTSPHEVGKAPKNKGSEKCTAPASGAWGPE